MLSRLMSNAGLGISGIGVKERVKLTYAPGEEVDEERVMKAVRHMIEDSAKENTDWIIHSPRVVSISPQNSVLTHQPATSKPHEP